MGRLRAVDRLLETPSTVWVAVQVSDMASYCWPQLDRQEPRSGSVMAVVPRPISTFYHSPTAAPIADRGPLLCRLECAAGGGMDRSRTTLDFLAPRANTGAVYA
jgi:hypothetical protein